VTPVRTPAPSIRVTWPTSTPGTSVIAFRGPGAPKSNGMPRSRARGSAAKPGAPDTTRTTAANVRIGDLRGGLYTD
jgi:hypothetical protein